MLYALTLLLHEAPRFGRLRLPQLGAGVSRNGFVKGPDARRGGIFLRSLQPGHLTLVGKFAHRVLSRPYRRVYLCARACMPMRSNHRHGPRDHGGGY
eukprot:COSAG02_NODE_7345_length_3053_cov_9.087339_3_plen_97_part_00